MKATVIKVTSPEISCNNYAGHSRQPRIKELMQKFESNIVAASELPKLSACKTHLVKDSIKPEIRHVKAKATAPSPITNLEAKTQQSSMFFVAEDDFAKLTVKDKARLYTLFISEMSEKNKAFNKHDELLGVNVRKEAANGEVINEKQESVKKLLEVLEAKCAFPKQTISPLALQRFNSVKTVALVKAKEFEDIHTNGKVSYTSTMAITHHPTDSYVKKENRRARSLPRNKGEYEEILSELYINEPCRKRNSNEMRSSLPIEAYAPPRKIRRTRLERLQPKIFFQNQQLENLFFIWLSERRKKDQEGLINKESTKKKIKSAPDEVIMKLETVQIEQKEKYAAGGKQNNKKAHIKPNSKERTFKISAPKKRSTLPKPEVNKTKITSFGTSTSTDSFVKSSEVDESESGLSSLPKITSDESQTDTHKNKSENSKKDIDFSKNIKALRKKKMRRTLIWRKETSLAESQPINSTDSDTDNNLYEAKTRNKMTYIQPQTDKLNDTVALKLQPESCLGKVEKNLRNLKFPPASNSTLESLNTWPEGIYAGECIKREIPRSWVSLVDNQINQGQSSDNKSLSSSSDISEAGVVGKNVSRFLADSFIDQGFETGSNDMDSPIRASKKFNFTRQLSSSESQTDRDVKEKPSCFYSTPIKEPLQQHVYFTGSPINILSKNRRKSIYDMESIRNSLAMQVICEDQPLEHREISSPTDSNSIETVNSPTFKFSSGLNPDNTSQFWIKCLDFSISFDILYVDPRRARFLYETFSQKSCDTKDLHFGINHQMFSIHNLYDEENISRHLPIKKGYSYYWFSTGDLIIPFNGKSLSADRIQNIFNFIKASVEENGILRFGIDALEFSNVSEFWNQSPSFSMDSNYSMLVGLQSGSSNGLEGRSKFAWPHSKHVRLSDWNQFDCEYFFNNDFSLPPFSSDAESSNFNSAAQSPLKLFMPRNSEDMMNRESFGHEYENESLDRLFDATYNLKWPPKQKQKQKREAISKTQKESVEMPQHLQTFQSIPTEFPS